MGVVIIVIPGALEGFLEEVTLNWALEVSRTVCGADTGHSLGESTEVSSRRWSQCKQKDVACNDKEAGLIPGTVGTLKLFPFSYVLF